MLQSFPNLVLITEKQQINALLRNNIIFIFIIK